MNRNTFFKKCFALIGIGTVINKTQADEPNKKDLGIITTNQLQLTDGKSTYVLIVENDMLLIKKIKTEEEKQEHVANSNQYNVYKKPNSVRFQLS